jgi:hypothetical protein
VAAQVCVSRGKGVPRAEERVASRFSPGDEILKVGAGDGEELRALEQRVPVVGRFVEHAPLEREKAEIRVEQVLRRVPLRRMGRRGVAREGRSRSEAVHRRAHPD